MAELSPGHVDEYIKRQLPQGADPIKYRDLVAVAKPLLDAAEAMAAAIKRAEGERDERLAQLLYTRDERDANFRLLVEANARVAALEAALRSAGERLHSALMGDTTMTVHAYHTFEATDTLSACPAYECVEARAALAPPERP